MKTKPLRVKCAGCGAYTREYYPVAFVDGRPRMLLCRLCFKKY